MLHHQLRQLQACLARPDVRQGGKDWLRPYLEAALDNCLCISSHCGLCRSLPFQMGLMQLASGNTRSESLPTVDDNRINWDTSLKIADALERLKRPTEGVERMSKPPPFERAVGVVISFLMSRSDAHLEIEIQPRLAGSWAGEILAMMRGQYVPQQATHQAAEVPIEPETERSHGVVRKSERAGFVDIPLSINLIKPAQRKARKRLMTELRSGWPTDNRLHRHQGIMYFLGRLHPEHYADPSALWTAVGAVEGHDDLLRLYDEHWEREKRWHQFLQETYALDRAVFRRIDAALCCGRTLEQAAEMIEGVGSSCHPSAAGLSRARSAELRCHAAEH